MTNKQWLLNQIQNMSDEELGDFLGCTKCEMCLSGNNFNCDSNCSEGIGHWLKLEHKETIKISDAERVVLENIDKDYKWIVRGKDGTLTLYSEKPTKEDTCWEGYDVCDFWAYDHLFQFIKWEDTEPYNIEELLKGE